MKFDGTFFAAQADRLEDFWGRRQNRPSVERQVYAFGQPIKVSSNHQDVLAAVDHNLPLYSVAPAADRVPFSVQLVVQAGPADPGPAPENLFDHIHYTGDAAWLTIVLGAWGHCFVDLAAGRAIAVVTPELARRPDLVSRCLLDTVLTNFFIADGFAMLHASCLVRDGRVLLLMAPHNSGKSTTALRLALAGFRLLSDSMVFLSPYDARPRLFGFPVGKIKLREDMLPQFPELHPFVRTELVRGETKYSLDLREYDPTLVLDEAMQPSCIELCLLGHSGGRTTHLVTATRSEVMDSIMVNSLFYDTAAVWRRNLALIDQLVAAAGWHHLAIGTDASGIITKVEGLWDAR